MLKNMNLEEEGLTNDHLYQKIAEHQGISLDGVRYHIKNIYKKLHVKSKAEVIKKYIGRDRSSWF